LALAVLAVARLAKEVQARAVAAAAHRARAERGRRQVRHFRVATARPAILGAAVRLPAGGPTVEMEATLHPSQAGVAVGTGITVVARPPQLRGEAAGGAQVRSRWVAR